MEKLVLCMLNPSQQGSILAEPSSLNEQEDGQAYIVEGIGFVQIMPTDPSVSLLTFTQI